LAPTGDEGWSPRRGSLSVGKRRQEVFAQTACKAIYEFAVQPEVGARRYPVYYRITEGFQEASWDGYLLKNPRIQKQVSRILIRFRTKFICGALAYR
jgi:hypothetical protein